MIIRNSTYAAIAAMTFCASLPAAAQETSISMADGAIELRGSLGILALSANEIVYTGPGSNNEISHLFWDSRSPMLTAGFGVNLPEGWTIDVDAQVALSGDSSMADYDWLGPDFVSYSFDDWTHRSQSDATKLDWYFNGSVLVGRDLQLMENVTVNLNGGLKYTDVQWAAYGASYVYSDGAVDNPGNNYRAYQGVIADDVLALTYRQRYPALIVGLDTEIVQEALTFDFSAHAGMTFNSSATDDHWLRDLRILDSLQMAPIVTLAAKAEYQVSDGVSLFVGGSVEKVFAARGDKQWWESGVLIPYSNSADSSGTDLFAASVSGGVKGTF